jgi:hypothetical protein
MKKILEKLQQLFQRSPNTDTGAAGKQINRSNAGDDLSLAMDESAIITLMRLIEHTKEGKYSCDETLDLLDEYVELAANKQDVAAIMPLVKNHISDCPDCTERYEALIQILQSPQETQQNY